MSRFKVHEKDHKIPIPTTDIILRKPNNEQEILIEIRGRSPFESMYSLPGGHVDYGETVENAILRELQEECGVKARLSRIFGVYSDPRRDPRGQRISTVFLGNYKSGKIKGRDDARSASWMKLNDILRKKGRIAFDHYQILSDYKESLKRRDRESARETFWSSKARNQKRNRN